MPMIKFAIYFIMFISLSVLISARLSGKSRDYSTIMRYVLIIDLICLAVVKLLEYIRG